MSRHAFLSPSAAHRWLHCPPSAVLCAKVPDQSSPYAQQGTDAHELCAYLVEKSLGRDVQDPTENLTFYDQEMQDCAEGYASFVMEEYEAARQNCPDTEILIEQRIDYSRWVKDGSGTADCIILSDGTAEVIDPGMVQDRHPAGRERQQRGPGGEVHDVVQLADSQCAFRAQAGTNPL